MKSPSAILLLVAGLVLCPLALAQDGGSDWVKIDTEPTYLGTYNVATGILTPPSAAPQAPTAAQLASVQTLSATPVGGRALNSGSYDVATGKLSDAPGVEKASAVIFDNTAGNGYFFTPGPGLENMDWGTTATGSANEIVGFQMGYATSSATPVDISIGLHEGATGFGDPGTAISTVLLSGLPASDGVAVAAYAIDVDISGTPITLADGAIGWSYEMFDTVTGPLLIGPPNEAGVIDAFDQYSGGFTVPVGTFFFGGVPFASFHMQLTASLPCTDVYDNSVGNGYFFTPGPGLENMDWGDLAIASDICEMQIGYATSSATPVDISIGLHDGATGFGDPGTAITTFLLSGLPASDGVAVAAYAIDVTGLNVPLGPGPIGWSYEMFDTVTGPLLIGPPNGAGVIDAFDQYSGGFTVPVGTFFFGGVPFASFHALLRGTGTPPVPPWSNYGTGVGMTLTGSGSGVPGDVQDVFMDGPLGSSASLVLGQVASDIFDPGTGINYYAFPWDFRASGIPIPFGGITLSGALPLFLTAGDEIFFQSFAQNALAIWKYSAGLKLTVQ